MTLTEHTIEIQMDELRRQYEHACNLISSLTELGYNQRQMIERRDQQINEQRQTITALECRLGAANSPVSECKCDGGCYGTQDMLKDWQKGL